MATYYDLLGVEPTASLEEIQRAYRLLFRSELNVSQALERAESDLEKYPEVRQFLTFVDNSQRGVVI